MSKTVTMIVVLVFVILPGRGHAQLESELERIEAAVRRELLPPPLEQWRAYVTEEFSAILPRPGDEAYEELNAMRLEYLNAVDRIEAEILSATFIGNRAIVLARVLVVYKPNRDLPSRTSANGDLELYEFERGKDEWLSAAAPFPYTPESFMHLYTRALESQTAAP